MTRIIAFPNPSAAADWRLRAPFKYLRKKGWEAVVSDEGITEQAAKWADIYVLQGCVDTKGIALLHAYQQEYGKKIVVDQDDLLEVEADNPYKIDHEKTNALEVIRITFGIADLVTTTNARLARQLALYTKVVKVLPNLLDLDLWDGPVGQHDPSTIRIGWAGSVTHERDLAMIQKPLTRILDRYPHVRLLLIGDPRLKRLFPQNQVELMLGVPFAAWPARLRGLGLDIGLAPLRDTPFNRAKSNIKWLEYSIARVPGVYSPTVYNFHTFDGTFGMIAENAPQWEHCVENLVLHEILRTEIRDHAYAWVRRYYDLKRKIGLWEKAYSLLA